MSKVFVVTEAKPLQAEIYKGGNVYSTEKLAEKAIREKYPNARKEGGMGGLISFTCKDKKDEDAKDSIENIKFMFIRGETVQ